MFYVYLNVISAFTKMSQHFEHFLSTIIFVSLAEYIRPFHLNIYQNMYKVIFILIFTLLFLFVYIILTLYLFYIDLTILKPNKNKNYGG